MKNEMVVLVKKLFGSEYTPTDREVVEFSKRKNEQGEVCYHVVFAIEKSKLPKNVLAELVQDLDDYYDAEAFNITMFRSHPLPVEAQYDGKVGFALVVKPLKVEQPIADETSGGSLPDNTPPVVSD